MDMGVRSIDRRRNKGRRRVGDSRLDNQDRTNTNQKPLGLRPGKERSKGPKRSIRLGIKRDVLSLVGTSRASWIGYLVSVSENVQYD